MKPYYLLAALLVPLLLSGCEVDRQEGLKWSSPKPTKETSDHKKEKTIWEECGFLRSIFDGTEITIGN